MSNDRSNNPSKSPSNNVFPTQPDWSRNSFVKKDERIQMLKESLNNTDAFWKDKSQILDWFEPFQEVRRVKYQKPVEIHWFRGGKLNACYNCIDRHLPTRANDVAFRWVPENTEEETVSLTFGVLRDKVMRLANVLKKHGVKKGDRVTIYMPMIPEAVYAILACARIGAVHSVIFGGFSPQSIADRIEDCQSECVITADEGFRGGKRIPLKANVDEALKSTSLVKTVLIVKRTGGAVGWTKGRDFWLHDELPTVAAECDCEVMDAEDPLFILYTSGSTGKPKGVLHTTGGYLVYAAITHKLVFDYHKEDVYWCAADVGWITGHTYIVYGPLANGARSVLYEGLPSYPNPDRIWKIIDTEKVNILYTAPTLIRALMRDGDKWLESTSRQSLRVLGSVGEPINPEAWLWYYQKVGGGRSPIVDTWWQTETGGILISPLPGATDLKPGSATFPIFGIDPVLLTDDGKEIVGEGTGHLCLKNSWPGQMRTVYRDHDRFEETYFSKFPGYYYTGDECHRDQDGYLWIIGRADDVINVSGHRLGTAEVESALVSHHGVAESAVVGFPHAIKGQGIYAFVTLKAGIKESENLKEELVAQVRKVIGPIATPDRIQWAPGLPKTRSGKIMRRILKKIAANDYGDLGDTTTLADPAVVETLIQNRT